MKMLSVRLDDSEFVVLSRLNKHLGASSLRVVKRGIAALAQQKLRAESPHKMAVKLGLIGVFGGRADLSETVAVRVRRKLRAESAPRR
ncbi:MAG: hypothetical protein A3H35_00370 [Betaproteobacteria bacterium RIFCSPLOWO2_02_FULL_62_17]|nr:MAG: hypothetical protein A3H35_00370 [Betaproteobacteria bacterium RIFCSPLOWO2_02_FULL_62_17]